MDVTTGNERRPTVDRRNGESVHGMVKRAVLTTSEVGKVSDTDQLIQIWWSETMQQTKRHNSHLKVDSFQQAQPMQSCNKIRDIVIMTKSKHQTNGHECVKRQGKEIILANLMNCLLKKECLQTMMEDRQRRRLNIQWQGLPKDGCDDRKRTKTALKADWMSRCRQAGSPTKTKLQQCFYHEFL